MRKIYDDLLDREHPTSETHPRMSMRDRAAQFSPFQALTGFGKAIEEADATIAEGQEYPEVLTAEDGV